MRWRLAIFALAVLLQAETGVTPRPKPEDFPVHEETSHFAAGAEFMVHSFGRNEERYVAEDYLTVEVGIYPTQRTPMAVALTQFKLRVNGKKDEISAAPPGFVAGSLKYPDWEQKPNLEAQTGPVTIGRPQPTQRFPGDNRPGQGRLPNPPQTMPDEAPKEPLHVAPSVLAREVAIEEGEHRFPVSGYVYFPYRGKIKGIKTLDLIYNNGSESVTLRLR